jgi:glutathione synthase/RimK-type ligase-like ATP-grasp enzyme
VNEVNILIISNTIDFTTDYVCLELHRRNANYLRINRDEFQDYEVFFDVLQCSLAIRLGDEHYLLHPNTLKAVYYRAPIYLRDIYKPNLPVEEQLFRTQWTAFLRNLSVFDSALWVNNPDATFKAENKILQLIVAKNIGLPCPNTIVTNSSNVEIDEKKDYIVKSLDSAILRFEDKEAFVYSNRVKGGEIKDSYLNLAPIILQDYISPKIDIRVTVIGHTVYAVRILKEGKGVEGDWRSYKNDIDFIPFLLPDDVSGNCISLVKALGLSFGGIDLIESDGNFYFIEINPTGEWAWLVNAADLKIFKGICDYLEGINV